MTRFEARGAFENRRRTLKGAFMGWEVPSLEAVLGQPGVDNETGAAVLIEPRGDVTTWIQDVEFEGMARAAAALALPQIVPVLHTGPGVRVFEERYDEEKGVLVTRPILGHGVVRAEPPPGIPWGTFSEAEAVELALSACVAAASLHAAGVGALCFDPWNLRVTGEKGAYRIAWLVPGVKEVAAIAVLQEVRRRRADRATTRRTVPRRPPALPNPQVRGEPVPDAVCGVARFLVELVPEGTDPPEPVHNWPEECPDLAAVARRLLTLAPIPPALRAAVDAMPAVRTLPPLALDWDAVIAEGESLVASCDDDEDSREFVALPLAAAYHQRAARAAAQGDPAAALPDAERAAALDPSLPHATTRAVLLDRLGRSAEARAVLDEAVPAAPPERKRRRVPPPADPERARALGARGMAALRLGDAAAAERDLQEALAADLPAPEAALYAHGLGAARHARGDFAGAAEAEARSVALAPENARYRWALVGSLRKLGKPQEARAEAERILAAEPGVAAHRERFARLFG